MKKVSIIFFFIFVILAFYICFFKLGNARLENWDEAWYADITRTMLKTGNYIVPFWNRSIYLDKPPLYMWLSAFFSKIFSLSEFALRLPSAIAGFLTIVMTTWYSRKKWGLVAMFLSFGTLALNSVYIWRTRTGNLDTLITFFIVCIYLISLEKNSYRKYIVLGLLFTLAYLTKASAIYPFLLLFFFAELLYEKKTLIRNLRYYLILLIIPIIVCGIWLYIGDKQIGSRFSQYYLFASDQRVMQLSFAHIKFDYFLFTYYSLQRRFAYFFIIGLLVLFLKLKHKESFLLLGFSLSLIGMLSFTERSNNWYLVPTMPFWSLIIGYATSEIVHFTKKIPLIQKVIVGGIIFFSLYTFIKTYIVNITPLINTTSTKYQANSGLYIQNKVKLNEAILRLDELYPTTMYYSDRKVFVYKPQAQQIGLYVGKNNAMAAFDKRSIRFIVGTKEDASNFMKEFNSFSWKLFYQNEKEAVYELIEKK